MSSSPEGAVPGITAAEVAALADQGVWDSRGNIRPDAIRLSDALVAGLKDGSGAGLLPNDLAELVKQVLAVAEAVFPEIEAADGVKLKAHVIRQLTPGPHPLVVVPAGWNPVGWPLFEYSYLVMALKGYHVLAYTPRGLGLTVPLPGGGYLDGPSTSGGTIDIGGPKDWADGSSVIDYAVERLAPSGIGFLGVSYGSGISQLVAAHDERVDAVVALSTWGNLADCLYENRTRHLEAVSALTNLTGGPEERKFDPETLAILRDFRANRNMDQVVAWGTVRAPESYVELTNARSVPTFFSNTWHEGLFAINQTLKTFNLLTGPKRLNTWIGDHTVPEGPALVGPLPSAEPNVPMLSAYAWLDHYLKGLQNGVPEWPQVKNQVMFTYTTVPARDPGTGEPTGKNEIVTPAVRESRATWADVTTGVERLGLTGARGPGSDGELAGGTDTGWQKDFLAGVATEAVAMDGIIATGQAEWAGNPKSYELDKVDREHALVWLTRPLSASLAASNEFGQAARRIRGVPKLHLTFRSTARSATLIAYLFDVDEDGRARIITHEPYTVYGLEPDTDIPASWDLQAAAYDVSANHRLALVIGSKDHLYGDASVSFTQTTVSSPESDPSYLDLPLG